MASDRNLGKRPAYVDLDAPDSSGNTVHEGVVSSQSTMTETKPVSRRAKQKMSAHEKDAGYPPKEYTAFLRGIAIQYYRRWCETNQVRFRELYLEKGEPGIMCLQADLQSKFEHALESSDVYNDAYTMYHYATFMERVVTQCTSNATHVFDCEVKKPRGGEYSPEDLELRKFLEGVKTSVGRFSSSRTRGMPWNEQALKSAMEMHMLHSVQFLPEDARVYGLSGYDAVGGYGKVRKVRIVGVRAISAYMEFAGKMPTASHPKEKFKMRCHEALICHVAHPGVIKFWAVNTKNMEAYTLWWNGGSWAHFRNVESKANPAASNNAILSADYISAQDTTQILAFRKNRARLAWALMCTMAQVHKGSVFHNDIAPTNILLHFPPEKPQSVYIGICDWGIASRDSHEEPSKYGFRSRGELEEQQRKRRWVAPELFYEFGPQNSETSLDVMQRRHLYTELADSYAIGWMAREIWQKEPDSAFFKSSTNYAAFQVKIDKLLERDPTNRLTVIKVVEELMAKPFNFEVPHGCYRYEI